MVGYVNKKVQVWLIEFVLSLL